MKLKQIFDSSRADYSPLVAAQKACAMTFSPQPNQRLNEQQQKLKDQAILTTTDIHGLNVQIYDWNPSSSKKALVIHGFGGRCLDYTEIVGRLVNQNFRVIGFDAPAHGFSEGKESDIGEFWLCLQKICSLYGSNFHMAIAHSFGSAALTYQMRLKTIQTENIVLLAPNAQFDSVLESFFKQLQNQLNAQRDVFQPICDITAERFASRIDRASLWKANSTVGNIKTLVAESRLKKCLIIHGKNDNMFSVTNSQEILQAVLPINSALKILDCGHVEIFYDAKTLKIIENFSKGQSFIPVSEILSSFGMLQASKASNLPDDEPGFVFSKV
jgi:pimeloyl-ACP methyl ester carboxylesterase